MSQLEMQRTEERGTTAPRPASRRTNRLVVWGLVLAILTLGGIGSILGIVFGARARGQARESGEGAGLATAAIVVGVISLIVAVGYWIVIAQHFGGSGGGGGGNTPGGGGGGY